MSCFPLLSLFRSSGVYCVPEAALRRASPFSARNKFDGQHQPRAFSILREIERTLGQPTTRQGRALLNDVERHLCADALGATHAALRKLPPLSRLQGWLDEARFDLRVNPRAADQFREDQAMLADFRRRHGVPDESTVGRACDQLWAEIDRALSPPASIASAKTCRALRQRMDAMMARLVQFVGHRDALIQARLDLAPCLQAVRRVAGQPSGVTSADMLDVVRPYEAIQRRLNDLATAVHREDYAAIQKSVPDIARRRTALRNRLIQLGCPPEVRQSPDSRPPAPQAQALTERRTALTMTERDCRVVFANAPCDAGDEIFQRLHALTARLDRLDKLMPCDLDRRLARFDEDLAVLRGEAVDLGHIASRLPTPWLRR
ncbi:hypothetical protein CDN99_05290 [Roseateles aquatilis]|uniref:Uncharacterized protein n=1 Tax=Roseateles aquatilis TaxID=431061 RepID=A0A246JMI0_9BURK|nr:hypothetical protein [Roseateles aquatilis]OWQ93848.1 hypothetical protein CDN99_05290 [Roseateles aquatilis]